MRIKLFTIVLAITATIAAFASQQVANSDFNANASLLSKEREGIWGKCDGSNNTCTWKCPKCKATYEADEGGIGYDITGTCLACGYVVP